MDRRTAILAGASLLVPAHVSCRRSSAAAERVRLNGAGATLPYPLYSRWIAEYENVAPEVRINYQAIGSGAAIRQLAAGTVDFGTSELPISLAGPASAGAGITNLPASIGAIAVAVNLPGLGEPLRLEPGVLAAIYGGRTRQWNDPSIARSNPLAALPARDIKVIHRTDGSGTTDVFSRYLASSDSAFQQSVGIGKSLRWPIGIGAKGNEGVAGMVKNTEASIGYMELAYARSNALAVAALRNGAGRFVEPSVKGATAAADGVHLQRGLQASLLNRPGRDAYPIVTFTYVLAREDMADLTKGRALARFVWWITHEGQRFAEGLDYAPLPPAVVERVEARLKQLSSQGRLLLSED